MTSKNSLGIYIHIPFCVKKCIYCDFYSLTDFKTAGKYCEALIYQIKASAKKLKDYTVNTVYIGGGTPSSIPPELIFNIVTELRGCLKVAPDAEISLECNPGTLTPHGLAVYRSAGINRLSIGLQSSNDAELGMLSRIHTFADFEHSYLLARMEGFENINIDIMYGLPNQKLKTLLETVNTAISFSPEHISLYGLKVEEATPLAKNEKLVSEIPEEKSQYTMYIRAVKALSEAGYRQYEISNFARKQRENKHLYECKHNLKYWNSEEYIGFGAAAYSFFGGRMYSYKKSVTDYIANAQTPDNLLEENRVIDKKEEATQYVMLRFRLVAGIDTEIYNRRFGGDFEKEYSEKMKPYLAGGFIEKTKNGYRFSIKGMLISNYILSGILDFS